MSAPGTRALFVVVMAVLDTAIQIPAGRCGDASRRHAAPRAPLTAAGWPVRRPAMTALTFLALLASAAPVPAAPRNAEADAAAYEHCMKLARQDPGAAQKLAQAWHERGGAHPADHCGAVALIGLKQYKEAAIRLEALAQAMTAAPTSLRAEVLDQAGQAWLLAGDPVRAYAVAGSAV